MSQAPRIWTKTLELPAVSNAATSTGQLGLSEGTLHRVQVIGLDSSGDLVDDVIFTLFDPDSNPIFQNMTPARAVADPRNFTFFNLTWPVRGTSNFTLNARRASSATPVQVLATFEWTMRTPGA